MYGAIVVAPAGATFTEPKFGGQVSYGAQVDVHVPGAASYRDFTVLMQDEDEDIGQSHMPYPTEVKGMAPINYRQAPVKTSTSDGGAAFAATSSGQNGTPATPILKAYVGDPVQVHALVTPGSEQMHVFSLGGESWPLDPFIAGSNLMQARGIGPWETLQATIAGGAGGGATVGDLFYGDLRRPFTAAGMWGLQRVMSDASCPIRPLDSRGCTGSSNAFITLDASAPATLITHIIPALPVPVVGVKPAVPAKPARTVVPPARGGQAMPCAPRAGRTVQARDPRRRPLQPEEGRHIAQRPRAPASGPRGWALGATSPLAVPGMGDPRGGSRRRGGPGRRLLAGAGSACSNAGAGDGS